MPLANKFSGSRPGRGRLEVPTGTLLTIKMLNSSPTPGTNPGISCYGMKANPTVCIWSKFECIPIRGCQDNYGLLETFDAKIPYFEDLLVFDL